MMRIGLLFLFVLAIAAQAANNETVMLQGAAQGTTYHIKFVRPTQDFASKDLRADILHFYSDLSAPIETKKDTVRWQAVLLGLDQLHSAIPVLAEAAGSGK